MVVPTVDKLLFCPLHELHLNRTSELRRRPVRHCRHTATCTLERLRAIAITLPPAFSPTKNISIDCYHVRLFRLHKCLPFFNLIWNKNLSISLSQPMDTPKKIRRERSFGAYKGVRMRTWGKWVSEVRIPRSGERIWLGSYDSPEKAARAYDAAQYCIRGEHARFNFPADRRPELPRDSMLSLSKKNIQEIAMSFASSEPFCVEPASSCSPLASSSSLHAAALQSAVVSRDMDDEYRVVGDSFVAPEATVGVEVTPSSPESLDLDDFLMLDTEWIDQLI